MVWARSPDGFPSTADPQPFLIPDRDSPFADYEEFGVEDPRVTRLEGEYIITYSAYSRHGVRIGLAKTKDFGQVERGSLITEAHYPSGLIFPPNFTGLLPRLSSRHPATLAVSGVCLGWALHVLESPAKVSGVGESWILQPENGWAITGYGPNVVFTWGAVPESDGTVKIYWGGADTVMCVGEANVSDLVALCLHHGRPAK